MLAFADHRRHVEAIIAGAMRACDPAACVARAIAHDASLAMRGAGVVAVGKAALGMVRGYERAAGQVPTRFVLTVDGAGAPQWARVGDHPLPTARNAHHAKALLRFIAETHPAPIVVLLSGGASALLSLPDHGLTIDDVAGLTRDMLCGGMTIDEINTVRRHMERLKGGRLALAAYPRPVHVLVLSDVIGNCLEAIGSGPCAADPTTYADALEVLTRRGLMHAHPRVADVLQEGVRGEREETPKPGDPRLSGVRHEIVGDNALAVRTAGEAAQRLRFHIVRAASGVAGEASEVGERLAREIAGVPREHAPACIILGGETTVTVGAATGVGGRNQEVALAAAMALESLRGSEVAIAAFATDGVDGATRAAGAVVTGRTCEEARGLGLDPAESLAQHDSGAFFERLGAALVTGPTGTNVNDLAIALRYA